MPLFVATHRHIAEACPLSPGSGNQVLSRVSASTAARYGVTILAEAIVDGEHRLELVVQATDQAKVERFLAFLAQFGTVEILPASSSEAAIARGGCVAAQTLEPAANPV